MSLVLLFLLIFLAGPVAFHLCIKQPPNDVVLRRLAWVAVLAVCVGLVLWAFVSPVAGVWLVAAALGFVWVGWIAILAWLVQLVRRVDARPKVRRWAMLMGVLCTTAPWFGLASAQTMLG